MSLEDRAIAITPRGSSIIRMPDGHYTVCDSEHNCRIVSNLWLAEETVRMQEQGFEFPYSTNFKSMPKQSEA